MIDRKGIVPSFEQFLLWSERFKIIPFFLDIPLKNTCVLEAFKSLERKSTQTFLLDSYGSYPNGRYSFFPLSLPRKRFLAKTLKEFPGQWDSLQEYLRIRPAPALSKNVPPFFGGAVGFLSYDCGRYFEKGWKSPSPPDILGVPLFEFGIYDDVVSLDHKTNKGYVFSCLEIKNKNRSIAGLKALYKEHKEKLFGIVSGLSENLSVIPAQAGIHSFTEALMMDSRLRGNDGVLCDNNRKVFQQPANNRAKFIKSVKKIKKYITSGDIYQANLSQRFSSKFQGEPIEFFRRLQEINPSPYSCFFRFPSHDIVSCSPELLLKKRGRILETRPIAGTRPRGKDPVSDKELSAELLLNEKERAEHIMLLDLERNDLGRVCSAGTVKVTKKMAIEKYSHVMHIVSRVQGSLKDGEDSFSSLRALFPGGTITGCPKVRCMEILDEIEPAARGPFFGSAGWIGYQGDCEMNLLIRTALILRQAKVFIQAGSGIVADSDPHREYEESLSKARALLESL